MKSIKVSFNLSALGRSKWYEHVLRFAFGGIITVFAGLIAKRFGPAVGGLFLAFPAIFPASATLIEKHEKEKKKKVGLDGTTRGREAAGLDATGAAIGSVGLVAFALVVWSLITHSAAWLTLILAALVWTLVSGTFWYLRKTKLGLRSAQESHPRKPKARPSIRF